MSSNGLSKRKRRTVEAFAEVIIEGDNVVITPKEIADNVARYIGQLKTNRIRTLNTILFVIENLFPRMSFWPFGKSFSKMSREKRKKWIQKKLQKAKSGTVLRDLAKLRTLVLQGYYNDPRVIETGIGFTPPKDRDKYKPDKLKPLGLPKITLTVPDPGGMECDVLVIGSGAGGAVVAYNAAKNGKDVLLIEEGPYVHPTEMTHHESDMFARVYKEGGMQTTVDFDMTIAQGQCLGGTTVINNAICFELNDKNLNPISGPDTLDKWSDIAAHIDRAKLKQSFKRVKAELGVKPLPDAQDASVPPITGGNWQKFSDGWDAMVRRHPELAGFKKGLFEKNIHRCLGCGYCNYGCPYERKLSVLETFITKAVNQHNARVITECHAVKIEARRGEVSGVHCELWDGRKMFIRAKSVVVAAGAIGSSVLLMKSGIRKNVGKRFSFNAATPLPAHFPTPIDSFDGVQMAGFVDANEFLLETVFNPPTTFSLLLPGWFSDHFNRMKEYNHFGVAGVVVGTDHNARVKRSGFARRNFGPVAYKMTKPDLARLKKGLALLTQVYFAAGADAVYPPTFVDHPLHAAKYANDPQAVRDFYDTIIKKPDDLTLNSAHPQGGNPMSDNPKIGVVDSQFRVHGHQNLYVCDASVFPTTISINPQLTIMAMADYFANLGVL